MGKFFDAKSMQTVIRGMKVQKGRLCRIGVL